MIGRVVQSSLRAMRAFSADRGGSIALVWAFTIVVVIAAAGGALDYGRAINTRGEIAGALDSAALAGAKQLSSAAVSVATVTQTVTDHYVATMINMGFTDTEIADPTVTVDPAKGLLTVTGLVPVPTYFITVIGIDSIPVATTAQVAYSRFDVELSLVLDVTGSMSAEMSSLRTAAQSVVDILIPVGTKSSESKVRIAMVPYSQGVNLGEYASKVSNGASSGHNCVTERMGPEQFTDAPYDYDGEASEFFGGGSGENSALKKWGWKCAPTPQMEPLTSKRNKLSSAINKLTDEGATAGQTGIAWGWYALSPRWSNLWPADSVPGEYDNKDILKFAILMTDGDFNTHYGVNEIEDCGSTFGGNKYGKNKKKNWWEKDDPDDPGCVKTYEWDEVFKDPSSYEDEPSKRARALCKAMKDEGITIFSIYLDTDNKELGRKIMKECASKNGTPTYFEPKNTEQMIAAFETIANKIQSIYLSK